MWWAGLAHAEDLLRADLVVPAEPAIDDRSSLAGCCKPFGIEDFMA